LLYGPYGNPRASSGALPTSIGFTGQQTDSVTGLDYFHARYYDPLTGQFLSADVVQGNAQGTSPYMYVMGNPETRTDPTGHIYTCGNECGSSGPPNANDCAADPSLKGCSTPASQGDDWEHDPSMNPVVQPTQTHANPKVVKGPTHNNSSQQGGSNQCTDTCAATDAAIQASDSFTIAAGRYQTLLNDVLAAMAIIAGIMAISFFAGNWYVTTFGAYVLVQLGLASHVISQLQETASELAAIFNGQAAETADYWHDHSLVERDLSRASNLLFNMGQEALSLAGYTDNPVIKGVLAIAAPGLLGAYAYLGNEVDNTLSPEFENAQLGEENALCTPTASVSDPLCG
jgi:RHS repeat-associated protein